MSDTFGTCDNCGSQGTRIQPWEATRPKTWPADKPFNLCRRCVKTVLTNMEKALRNKP